MLIVIGSAAAASIVTTNESVTDDIHGVLALAVKVNVAVPAVISFAPGV